MSILLTLRVLKRMRVGFFLVLLMLLPTEIVHLAHGPQLRVARVVAEVPRATSPVLPGPEGPAAVHAVRKLRGDLLRVVTLAQRQAAEKAAADAAAAKAAADAAAQAAARQQVTTTTTSPSTTPVPTPAAVPVANVNATGSINGYPCGGNLPSCCTLSHESGGNPMARNSSSASGLWQFIDSTWNYFGGYSSAYLAPPSVQNAKAVLAFAGGAGASNWYGDGCYPGG